MNDNIAEQARTYRENYGDPRRHETWRWTPLTALSARERKSEGSDYHYDLPDAIHEDYGCFPDADRRLLDLPDAPFAAQNLAEQRESLLLTVPEGAAPATPAAINIGLAAPRLQHSRIHLRLGKNSRTACWFDYRVSRAGAQLPVLTIDAAAGAELDLALWFHGEADTAQLMQIMTTQAAGSRIRINALQAGGSLHRLDIHSELRGEESHFAFGGIQHLRGNQIADYHLNVRHHTENSESHQIVRGALDDNAQGYFDGMIYVAHGAQKTDARQNSRYILLHDNARSQSVPRLEIYADDVQCAHGSTTGRLDPDALFYLQSRGISPENARKMLILSFLHEAVVIEHPAIADAVHDAISRDWLGEDPDDKDNTHAA
ncbi:Fe-S cluster assembly protein SufD [uncultured Cardiobacterium sp.]|uniref:Fe-S cluster assembly protein SufD n=1 Tax=uncultured Cardiobacterium sp. TaxID=417619 RepID=UPI002603ED35|nr:Fe-S cluster assembly protein SufD [uncultured Cardiobacterium sp.]